MKKHREEKRGELFILGEVILHSLLPIGMTYGTTYIPQLQFLAYLTLLTSLVFFAFALPRRELSQLTPQKHPSPKHYLKIIGWLVLYTLCTGVVPYTAIFYAAHYTSSIDISLLLQSEAVYAALLGWLILKERLPLNKILGIILIISANVMIIYRGGLNFNAANIVIALAPVIFVFGNIIAKNLQNDGITWAPLLFFRHVLAGGIILILAASVETLSIPAPNLWPFLLAFSIFVFGFAKIFWQLALKRMDVSKVAGLGSATPVITMFAAYFLLNEIPTLYQIAAVLIIGLGIWLLLRTTSKQYEQLP